MLYFTWNSLSLFFLISNLSIMDMTVSSQIIFSEVPKKIILNGITGISNCSPESTHAGKVLSRKRTNMYFKMAASMGVEESGILPAVFLVVHSSLATSSLGLLTTYFNTLRGQRPPSHKWDPVSGRHTLLKESNKASTLLHLPEVNGMFFQSYKHA